MKRMKKILAVLLAAIMVMSMGTSVFADDDTYSIKITNVATDQHIFEAYQVFSGTLSNDGSTLSNVGWGSGIVESLTADETTIYAALAAISIGESYPFTDSSGSALTTAAEVAKVLSGEAKDSAITKAFATAISAYLTSTATGTSTTPTEKETDGTYTYTISGLSVGYYLVKDQDNSLANKTDESYTAYILLLTDSNASMEVKSEVASVSKVVATTEDGTGSEAVTASIGDTLYYTITVTVPDLTEYSSYALTISDTLSTGLTLTTSTDDVSVTCKATVNSTADSSVTLTSGSENDYTISLDDTNNKLTVTFSNIYSVLKTANADLSKGATVTVTYKATLNSSAVVGTTSGNSGATAPYGNTNTVTLTYSNDPNDSSSTGTTTDKATVYTFELAITKTDASTDSAMVGVKFKLTNSSSQYAKVDTNGKITGWTSDETEASEFTTDSDGKITITGLAAGTYYLKETETLDGYNLPSEAFTIVIGDTDTSYALSGFTSLSATVDGESASVTESTGVVSGGITNTKGSTLPTTGGIGTTIFYVVGAILVLGAGVVLITRRRMANR